LTNQTPKGDTAVESISEHRQMERSELTTKGLKAELKGKDYTAICEYIWNGFDAGASQVDITCTYNDLGGLVKLEISDNGSGILESSKFKPVFESEKRKNLEERRILSLPRGKRGRGRYTFFRFALGATWKTIFKSENGCKYKYEIYIQSASLLDFEPTDYKETEEETGTKVIFEGLNSDFSGFEDSETQEWIKKEFSWFLYLYKSKGYSIKFNSVPLNYSNFILSGSDSSQKVVIEGTEIEFDCILWSCKQNHESSRYYFIDSSGNEKYTKPTTLNNKSDDFFHSVFIKSDFFDQVPDLSIYDIPPGEASIFTNSKEYKTYNRIIDYLENFLHDKRRPFLEKASIALITEFEEEGIFPKCFDEKNPLDQFRKEYLYSSVRELYQVQPKIFTSLKSKEQKKIFVRFLEELQHSGKSDKILEILEEVMSLSSEDLDKLAKTLKSSKLSNIVKTIQLIEDRFKFVKLLKECVNNLDLKANERDHLQKMIETNYWIFGEKYHLVCKEEADFESALQGYIHILRDDDENSIFTKSKHNLIPLDDPGRRKQVDIFMCRKSMRDDSINHIIVEIKHPNIVLGLKELTQVEQYMRTILKNSIFNSRQSSWDFYLIGRHFDDTIETRMDSAKNHGEKSLVMSVTNPVSYKIYVKTWSEIFDNVEIRHQFLQDTLLLEKDQLMKDEKFTTPEELVEHSSKLSCVGDGPIVRTPSQRQRQDKTKKAKGKC